MTLKNRKIKIWIVADKNGDVGGIRQRFLSEQEGLPRAAAGTDLQSVGTNCETKAEFASLCRLVDSNSRLTDGCIFPMLFLCPSLLPLSRH